MKSIIAVLLLALSIASAQVIPGPRPGGGGSLVASSFVLYDSTNLAGVSSITLTNLAHTYVTTGGTTQSYKGIRIWSSGAPNGEVRANYNSVTANDRYRYQAASLTYVWTDGSSSFLTNSFSISILTNGGNQNISANAIIENYTKTCFKHCFSINQGVISDPGSDNDSNPIYFLNSASRETESITNLTVYVNNGTWAFGDRLIVYLDKGIENIGSTVTISGTTNYTAGNGITIAGSVVSVNTNFLSTNVTLWLSGKLLTSISLGSGLGGTFSGGVLTLTNIGSSSDTSTNWTFGANVVANSFSIGDGTITNFPSGTNSFASAMDAAVQNLNIIAKLTNSSSGASLVIASATAGDTKGIEIGGVIYGRNYYGYPSIRVGTTDYLYWYGGVAYFVTAIKAETDPLTVRGSLYVTNSITTISYVANALVAAPSLCTTNQAMFVALKLDTNSMTQAQMYVANSTDFYLLSGQESELAPASLRDSPTDEIEEVHKPFDGVSIFVNKTRRDKLIESITAGEVVKPTKIRAEVPCMIWPKIGTNAIEQASLPTLTKAQRWAMNQKRMEHESRVARRTAVLAKAKEKVGTDVELTVPDTGNVSVSVKAGKKTVTMEVDCKDAPAVYVPVACPERYK